MKALTETSQSVLANPTGPDNRTGTQSVDRATQLLRFIGETGPSGASLGELSNWSGLAKPTCRRLLLALIRAGLIAQTEHENRYWLGSGLYALANKTGAGYFLSESVRGSVRDFAVRHGETCLLSVRRGNFAVVDYRVDHSQYSDVQRASPGAEYPLGIGAASLAIIAAISEKEAEESLKANDHLIHCKFRRATIHRILEGREEAMSRGFALNRGMVFDGTWGLGVAIKDAGGCVVGALSVSTKNEALLSVSRQVEIGTALAGIAAHITTGPLH